MTLYKPQRKPLISKVYKLMENYDLGRSRIKTKDDYPLGEWLLKKNETFRFRDYPIYNMEYMWMGLIRNKKRKRNIKNQINYYLTYRKKYKEYMRLTHQSGDQLTILMKWDWFERYKDMQNWLRLEKKEFKGNIKYITDIMDECDLVDLARSPLGLLDHYSKLSKIVYTKLNAYRIVFGDDIYLYNLRVFNRKIFKIFNLVEKNIKFNKNNNILFNRSLIIL